MFLPSPYARIRAGFSIRLLTLCRNCAATEPSTTRHHDLVFHGVDTEDRDFRLVDDRGEALDAVHAEVRDGKGAAAQFFGRQLALAGQFGQFLDLGGDLRQALLVCVNNVGNHQTVVQGHCDTHVDIVLVDDLVVLNRAVEQRELRQGLRDKLHQQIGIADLDFLRLELLAVALHLGHVDAQVEGDGRRGHVRVLHVLGDGLAHAAHGLDFLALALTAGAAGAAAAGVKPSTSRATTTPL